MSDDSSFPARSCYERVLAGLRDVSGAGEVWPSSLYLSLAEGVVREAFGNWLDADGAYRDPFERSDRWDGGCLARLVCPAAILVSRAGCGDLLEPTMGAMDRLMRRVAAGLADPRRGLPPGVADLIVKEIAVALLELRAHVDSARFDGWCEIMGALDPDSVYTGRRKRQAGQRLTNYEVYASVGEWLRWRLGIADRRDWIEEFLGASLELMTENGMYRDPGDPMLYDLSVRQNLSELLFYGYDGTHRERLQHLLRRAGVLTLAMQSPLGWAPCGGRSNLFVHNEAMLAYLCETEARRWLADGESQVAEGFRGAARRAVEAVVPFMRDMQPPHNLKNHFDPVSKLGRDSGYGEYGVYSLLGASLLARTALVADESLRARPRWAGAPGAILLLQPAFHRVLASVGDTHAAMDLAAQSGYDATGIGRFHRVGVPPSLGLSSSIAARPRYITGSAMTDRAVAVGPVWRTEDGSLRRLAEWSGDPAHDVEVRVLAQEPSNVRWRVTHRLDDDAVATVSQEFSLQSGRLDITVEVHGDVAALGLEVPCLLWDGRCKARRVDVPEGVEVHADGARLTASVHKASRIEHDPCPRASREAWYTSATLWAPDPHRLSAQLGLGREGD